MFNTNRTKYRCSHIIIVNKIIKIATHSTFSIGNDMPSRVKRTSADDKLQDHTVDDIPIYIYLYISALPIDHPFPSSIFRIHYNVYCLTNNI